MKKIVITLCLPFISLLGISQNIGINSTGAVPNVSAGLDIDFTNRGLLVPRIALTGINDAVTIATPATSLLVYNTNAGLPDGVGYYYNSGTSAAPVWIRLTTGGSSNDWTLLGNTGTNPAINFIGTTDAQDWVIRTNNVERVRVKSGGFVGLGTGAPQNQLDVEGAAVIGPLYSGTNAAPANGLLVQGNVGIGETVPAEKLEVAGNILSDGFTNSFIISDRNTNGNENGLHLRTNGTNYWQIGQRGSLNEDLFFWDVNSAVARLFISETTGNVGVATLSPDSRFEIAGSFGAKITSINSGPYTAGDESTILVDAGTGAITVNLPAAATAPDRMYYIKKTDATNAVTIDANGGELIDGATTQTLSNQFEYYRIISDGAAWFIIGTNISAGGGGGGSGFSNVQVFTANGTFTVPAGVTNIMVEVIGGGGGGASGSAGGTRGCGGMGGGYGKSYFTVVPGANHAVVIGAGGTGAPGGPCSLGNTGGTSTFGSPVVIQSTGGQGGNGCGSNSSRNGGTSTGQINMQGARGPDGQTVGRHYGGLSGNGSTIGQGGIGDTQFFGRDGEDGVVYVHW